MKINCHSDFQPLKEIIVGRSYHQDSFNFIKEPRIRDPLKRILEETETDLLDLCAVLEEHNVKVYRPDSPPVELVQEYIDNSAQPPIPSLAVRDGYITVADTLYRFVYKEEMNSIFNLLIDGKTFDPYRRKYNDFNSLEPMNTEELKELTRSLLSDGTNMYTKDYGKFIPNMDDTNHIKTIRTHLMDAPCLVRLGQRLIVDHFPSYQRKWINKEFSQYTLFNTDIRGHSDGAFCPIKPGLYVHTKDWQEEYKKSAPGWEGVYLPNQGWESDVIKQFKEIKFSNDGKWWVQGEEHNDALINFVKSWLDDWLGYIDETTFDVNMLSINENLILCTNEPPQQVKEAFKRHKVEYIITPFRHRFFWDGGLHCITLDVNREGNCEDYFR